MVCDFYHNKAVQKKERKKKADHRELLKMQRAIVPIFPAGWMITDDPSRTRAASELKKFCFSDRGQ